MFDFILARDPHVLLRSDVDMRDDVSKAKLAASLLAQLEVGDIGITWDLHRYYRRLKHAGLEAQLRPYVEDKAKSLQARITAVHLAEECAVDALQSVLVDLALDQGGDLHLRQAAASAVAQIGDRESKLRLRPLAEGDVHDLEDNLKAEALGALWPGIIDAAELFRLLTKPKSHNHFGSYYSFSHKAVRHLDAADLPLALAWVGRQPSRYHVDAYYFDSAIDEILRAAWLQLDDPKVLAAFVRTTVARLRRYEELFPQAHRKQENPLRIDDARRKRLVEAVLALHVGGEMPSEESDGDEDAGAESVEKLKLASLIFEPRALVFADDLPWLLERYGCAAAEMKSAWLEIIELLVNTQWYGKRELDPLLEACASQPDLERHFSAWLTPIALDSDLARRLRTEWEQHQQQLAPPRRPTAIEPALPRIERFLKKFENGDFDAFWRLQVQMTASDDKQVYEHELNITEYPGWAAMDTQYRARFLAASKQYLLKRSAEPDSWLGKRTLHRPAWAGYRALRLLAEVESGWIDSMPAEVWQRWAPTVLAIPILSDEKPDLIEAAYRKAPSEVLSTLSVLIDEQDRDHQHSYITQHLAAYWDERLAAALLEKAKDDRLSPTTVGDLLEQLVAKQSAQGIAYAASLVSCPLPSEERKHALALGAAAALLVHAPAAAWPAVWPALRSNSAFGRAVMTRVANGLLERHHAALATRLAEEEVADLYLWMSREFPHAEDPEIEGAHAVGDRENLGDYRDALLRVLVERGTDAACAAITRIARELPQIDFSHALRWAKLATLRATWNPPSPKDVAALARSNDKRVVTSAEHLQSLVLESLERLQQKLQGEIPAVNFLWDRTTGAQEEWRPKKEEDLSNYVALHLKDDLQDREVVVNREVRIRWKTGGAPGEITDIHVDAFSRETPSAKSDKLEVIIETKGCWNAGLELDMERQLRDRYLKDNDCRHGIYLVGWFNCAQWTGGPSWTIEQARLHFSQQAQHLSVNGTSIAAVVLNTALR